jgi:hypothetical protein
VLFVSPIEPMKVLDIGEDMSGGGRRTGSLKVVCSLKKFIEDEEILPSEKSVW